MSRSKIEFCDYTWNPITGCLGNCDYCIAKKMIRGFSGDVRLNLSDERCSGIGKGLYILEKPFVSNDRSLNYPFGFAPTLHEYRLSWPEKIKTGSNILVCAFGDLFGEWVPNEWIKQVFDTCRKHQQHNYLFLTKNPSRYLKMQEEGFLPSEDNMWYGSYIETAETAFFFSQGHKTFVCIGQSTDDFSGYNADGMYLDWVVVSSVFCGEKIQRETASNISMACEKKGVPLFMEYSLQEIMGNDFKQQFPSTLMEHKMSEKKKKMLYEECGFCKKEYTKKEMVALLSREGRGKSAVRVGYLCRSCFETFKNSFDSREGDSDAE